MLIIYGFTEINYSIKLWGHFRKLPLYLRNHVARKRREKRHTITVPCAVNHEGPTSKCINHSAPKWKYKMTSKQVAQSLFTS